MAKGNRVFPTNDKFAVQAVTREHSGGTVGSVTSAPSSSLIVVQNPGAVSAAFLSVGTNGTDGTNPLSVTVAITNTRTAASIFTTAPVLGKGSGAVAANTIAAATGITPAVLNTANTPVLAGDVLKVVWTLTRTASPTTEMIDLGFKLVITETQDFDPVSS